MAHTARTRFPARPWKKSGRSRIPSLRKDLKHGFDAALPVSAAIGKNLHKFHDLFGESSSSEDEQFLGFCSDDNSVRSPTRCHSRPQRIESPQRKLRGRQRTFSSQSSDVLSDSSSALSPPNKPELKPDEKEKKQEQSSGERRRGRPPVLSNPKVHLSHDKKETTNGKAEKEKTEKEKKVKKKPSVLLQQATKIKKLRAVKLSPLQSKLKKAKLQINSNGGKIERRRGRPPSSERLKTIPKLLIPPQPKKQKKFRKEKDVTATPKQSVTKEVKTDVKQRPRRISKPVRVVPVTKRTDAAIAKQLLQRAKKGAQKRMASPQLKNIRQFIMPVISAISSRIIKTPKRFIEDDSYVPPVKVPRLESTPAGRFSTISCGSSEKSSAVSQHSSQMSSDSSRSSSPSVTSTDSQASDELQTLPEVANQSTDLHSCLSTTQQSESGGMDKKGHRFSMPERSNTSGKKLSTSSPQPTSSSPPPPLLSPPPPLQQSSNMSDHSPWLMPPTIPFIPPTTLPEKRKSILREPTFKWTSLKNLRPESHQYFSSAKYAKEGLIRKPIFDNFITSPLTPEDVGLPSRFHASSNTPPPRFFSQLHPASRFDTHKRSPLLRAPRFTPSEAHSRIFESVTVSSHAVGRSSVAASAKGHSSRRKKKEMHVPSRTDPKSPSHSMRTRSGRLISTDLSPVTPQSSVASSSPVSSILTGALTPPLGSLVHTEGTMKDKDGRSKLGARHTSTPGDSYSVESASPTSPLFPSLAPSVQKDKGKNKDKLTEDLSKEKDNERGSEKDRDRDKEKENKRETRKDKEKKSQSKGTEVQCTAPLFLFPRAVDEDKATADAAASSSMKKVSGRTKKLISVDKGVAALGDSPAPNLSDVRSKNSKKGRLGSDEVGPVTGDTENTAAASISNKDKPAQHSSITALLSSGTLKHSAPAISSMLAQADKMPTTDKRVANLLRRAKAQLCKIEKSKSLKITDPTRSQGQESDSSEASIRGPRIKHVCRRAAVALGRKRAVFPDDMPTLSALPWEEREKILSSMGNDDKSSVAGSEDAEPPAPIIKPVAKHKVPQEPIVRKGRRSRRCGQCPGCQVPDDCGQCTNCLDKPKFGGRNVKKQCCKMRKCQNLQWMPSKAPPQKPVKVKKKEKKTKTQEKKELPAVKQHSDSSHKSSPQGGSQGQEHAQKINQVPHQHSDQQFEEDTASSPSEARQQTALVSPIRKPNKQPPQPPDLSLPQQPGPVQLKKESIKPGLNDPKKKQPLQTDSALELNKQKKAPARFNVQLKTKKPKEKDKVIAVSKFEPSTLSLLTPLTNVTCGKQKPLADGVHRIRVDFKEDCDVENVWEMGGLSILTSLPITPRVVCFLCASSGHVEFVYCQVCCEPFHLFCLEENERPLEEQWENWCCRRCKFCHVCCRQNKSSKQLLECGKCRNSYHPECLGPNYPTKPTKKKKVWICTKCVRCKSCGATTPGKGWDAQWSHDFSLCHECAKLFDKGNFCPLCDKCYDDDDYESKMMQCGKCDRWVHAKCESLSDEMYEILSNLPESVAYTCINCTEQHPAEWRLALGKELQISLKQVLTALLNSRTTSHLLRYRQAAKPPDLDPETEEAVSVRSSPEGPDPPVLIEVNQQDEQPLDLEGVKRKMEQERYHSVLEFSDDIVKIIQTAMNCDGGQPENKKANSMVKAFFIRQMERFFPWFRVKESKFWEPNKVTPNSGMLPNAVLPPSSDHNYAQWQEREESTRTEQPALTKKIIPAPQPKGPGDPDSPVPLPPPPLAITAGSDRSREDSPELDPPPDVEDNRQCVLCLKYGDDNRNDAGRLLYIGQNEWTHINCALWSAEVFEDDDGSLKNVHMAVIRGKQLRCECCQKSGATVGCCLTSCQSNYHFMCARAKNCVFLDDKKVYCQRHKDLVKGETVADDGFAVSRRVYVDFEDITLRRKFLTGLEPESIHMMIGSMTIDCLGILNDLSDCEAKLFPIGYQCSRVYWSTTDARKRCVYTCKILEHRPPPVEAEENSTLEHSENRTIAHSPSSPAEIDMAESHNTNMSEIPDHHPPSLTPGPIPPRLQPGSRIQTSSFSPTRRSPSTGSRPLPSPGSPTPMIHEVVTFADALLSSGRRSTISRRHSTSSVSPQHSRHRMASPSQMGMTCLRSSGNANTSPLSSLNVLSDTETGSHLGELVHKAFHSGKLSTSHQGSGPSSRQRFSSIDSATIHLSGVSQAVGSQPNRSPLTSTGHYSSKEHSLSSSGNQSRNSALKGENISAVNALDGSVTTSASAQTCNSVTTVTVSRPSQKEPFNNSGLHTNSNAVSSIAKETKGCTLPFHPKDSRRLVEQNKDAVQTGKISSFHTVNQDTERTRLQSVGVSHVTATANEHPRSNCTEKRPGAKASSTDLSRNSKVQAVKHFEGCPSADSAVDITVNAKAASSLLAEIDKKAQSTEESKQKFGDRSAGIQHSLVTITGDGVQSALEQVQSDIGKKEMLTSQNQGILGCLEPDYLVEEDHDKSLTTSMSGGSSQGGDEAVSSSVVPSVMSESPENEREVLRCPKCNKIYKQRVKNLFQKHVLQCGNQTSQDDGDGNKTQDNDSNKRRYPRRSARARSTTFFGLTPFYGVKSYGEEDFPFYRDPSGKKRGEQSTQGQVDGADDPNTSSDEDMEYYYNFTRTVITSDREGRLEPCNFFDGEEDCHLPRISQLDGVDDGTESDASVAMTVGKATQVSKIKAKENGTENLDLDGTVNSGVDDVEKEEHGVKSVSDLKGNDSKLDNCLPVSRVKSQGQDSIGEVSLTSLDSARRVHSSTPSDKNLLDSFNTDLLKSANDSDNNNSDDCGNILPSDIMDFVLKNTQSMQALGESPESSSSELITLGEGLGLVSNRGKDMGSLFEVFSQPLPSTETVESDVSASIPAEEPFELPLELPSDLSVLTTCSPTVSNQSHSSLTVISTSQVTSSEDQSVLNIPAAESVEKGVTVTGEKSVAVNDAEVSLIGHQVVEPSGESHIASDQFMQSHMDTDQLTTPACSQVEQGPNGQDITGVGTSSPVVIPASVSSSVPPPGQKYIASPADSPGPAPIANTAVQTATPLLKPGTDNVIVVNQHGHPLYVLQTYPSGVTQKINLAPSVGPAQAVVETSNTVLAQNVSMGGSLALATGLNVSLPASQSICTSATMASSKGLLTLSQHPQLHSFAGPTTPAFQSNSTSSPSGLLIGVQSPPDPQLLNSESSQRPELLTATTSSPGSAQAKKRPINRLPSKKGKKLAPSYQQTSSSASEIVPNITLNNFSPSQVPGGITNQTSLVDLGALANTGPQRTIPNIIKRPKSAVMYFEQSPLSVPQLQQNLGAAGSTNMIGPENAHLAAGNVSALGPAQSVLNVVSMEAATAATSRGTVTGHILGQSSVTLTTPMLLGATDITGSISNLLIKASQQSLGLSDQAVPLSGTGMFQHLAPPHSPNSGPLSPSQNICLLPSNPAVSVPVAPSSSDQDGAYQLNQQISQLLSSKGVVSTSQLDTACSSGSQISTTMLTVTTSVVSSTVVFSTTSMSSPVPVSSVFSSTTDQSPVNAMTVVSSDSPKVKPRVKRASPALDKQSIKKHKSAHIMTESFGDHQATLESESTNIPLSSSTEPIRVRIKTVQNAAELDGHQQEDGNRDSESPSQMEHMPTLQPFESMNTGTSNTEGQDDFVAESKSSDDDDSFSSPLLALLEQEEKRKEIRSEKKAKKGLMFQITSDDGFQIQCDNIEEGWRVLTDKVQEARSNARLKHISFSAINGLKMLGISHDAVVFLIEQLYGAKRCKNYSFKFHKHQEVDELPINPHGSARAEIHQRKSAFDMFNFLASKHRQPPDYCPNEEEEEEVQLKSARRATSMDLPMAMRFRHLKKTSKEAVGVYRSPIHGRGLFCKRNIDAGEMVIEYSGNVIRSVLTDKREKYYDSKGIGCYMFRIDDYEVVDATMHGNAARFINHSCEPNCYSRVINVDGQKHIVIFAVRKIYRGEELTYDYKFPIEDASNKLPCNCGAKKCRKFLN
ncbi:histone-lysine N-methyltransferase 2A isoform X3 [Chiloscyllium plagiosum]|uniref:histone-lysine N-methyltransferase 2A isoform X3 n=1 Tax=Chiloscyllium plagiosum TaxID=36176 RepID=UPI001CB7F910|nr:histone-lysine N-methyltransferase 2A isoform X3 [Chiloscyllium plagiosum]